jgi:putative transposase
LAGEVRLVLSDAQSRRIEALCSGNASDPGASGRDNRMVVEGGSVDCADRVALFGTWNSEFKRFSRCSRGGVWHRIFGRYGTIPTLHYAIIDSTIVRAHQHVAEAKGTHKITPLGARAAARRPRFTSPCAASSCGCASSLRAAGATTSPKPTR